MADSVRGPTLLDLSDIAQEKMNECLLQCPILSNHEPPLNKNWCFSILYDPIEPKNFDFSKKPMGNPLIPKPILKFFLVYFYLLYLLSF